MNRILNPTSFLDEVVKRVGGISEGSFAAPLIGSRLEGFMNPLLRSDFYFGRERFLTIAPNEVLPMLVYSKCADDRKLAAASEYCNESQIAALSSDSNAGVLGALAGNSHLTVEVAQQLIKVAPIQLAKSKSTSLANLKLLAESRNSDVRMAVAENPNCDFQLCKTILAKCASDKSSSIRQRIVEHPNCDAELLKFLDEQKTKPTIGDEFSLLLAIADHPRCPQSRRKEIFSQLGRFHDSYIVERGLGDYTIHDDRLDLMVLANCPDQVRIGWMKEIVKDPDDRYALAIVVLGVCAVDLREELVDRLINSKSKHIAAQLGDEREKSLRLLLTEDTPDLRNSVIEEPLVSTEVDDKVKKLVGEFQSCTLSGDILTLREIRKNSNCPNEIREKIDKRIASTILSVHRVDELEDFDFQLMKSFREERNNPLAFLNVPMTTDIKRISKAAKSKDWVERASVALCRDTPFSLLEILANDPVDTVRQMSTCRMGALNND